MCASLFLFVLRPLNINVICFEALKSTNFVRTNQSQVKTTKIGTRGKLAALQYFTPERLKNFLSPQSEKEKKSEVTKTWEQNGLEQETVH